MSYLLNKLAGSEVELLFTVSPTDYQKDVEQAALRLSERAALKGFRPGKAPYEIVKQQLGELKILEEALEPIARRLYLSALKKEKLETVGAPKISIEKIAPGNDLVFKATVALLPGVILPNFSSIKIETRPVAMAAERVDEVLENLRKMQPKETIKSGAAEKDDKVTLAMNMFIDNVPVEGGEAKNHQVYLNEPHYIPGFAEKILGLAKNDTKEFTLPFPSDHYQKHLAGKNVNLKVKINEVFKLEYAVLNDEFAQSLGQESLAKLKELLLANLTREAENKEAQRQEQAILEQLIAISQFETIPQILIDAEKQKMFYELKTDLERRHLTIENYLLSIKKTEEQIFNEFAVGAAKRAQAALVSRAIAKQNNIAVSPEELQTEIALIQKTYKDDPKIGESLKRPEVLDTIAATVQNRKVVEWLKEKVLAK